MRDQKSVGYVRGQSQYRDLDSWFLTRYYNGGMRSDGLIFNSLG